MITEPIAPPPAEPTDACLRAAEALARAHGHEWGVAWSGTRALGARHQEGAAISQELISGYTVDGRRECDIPGICAPCIDPDGSIHHSTHTNRLSWLVAPDGGVELVVSRPQAIVLTVHVGADGPGPRSIVWVRENPHIPLHERHIIALGAALGALCGRGEALRWIGRMFVDLRPEPDEE